MRFMHLADVHLGAQPDKGSEWSETRKNEIWETFRSCMEDAKRERIDLLLIAGDLFHRQPMAEQLREVNYLFSALTETRVVLIAGNHDYLQPTSAYLDFPWAENVVCLFSRECECIRFPEIATEVYGFSYYHQEIMEGLYDGLEPVGKEKCRILLAHGGDARHIPLDQTWIRRSHFDYIALGHIHKMEILAEDKAAFAGSLEPLDCTETGQHGYILGEYRNGHTRIRFVPKAKRQYIQLPILVREDDTTFSLKDRLERAIEQRGWQHIYQVRLQGSRDPGIEFDQKRLKEYGMILDIVDETRPALHLEELKRNYHNQLIGRYIESFEGHDRSRIEEKALQYGLEALLGAKKDPEGEKLWKSWN